MSKPAVFLDRDGTVNIDYNYVHKIDDFDFIEGAIDACRALKEMGYLIVIVTNQSGIGRGFYNEAQFMTLTEWMDWSMAEQGVDIDGVYYCPHLSTAGCTCRKPNPGMLIEAAAHLDIDLSQSFMVGDRLSDLQAGKAAGVKASILVETGAEINDEVKAAADYVIQSIAHLPKLIKMSS